MAKEESSKTRQSRLSPLPISRLFPNMVTILGLCIGITSVRYALDEKWEHAAALIIIAAFIDGADGRVARMLNASSNFGAHLDTLTDFLNFSVAPALVLYLWKIHEIPIKGLGWAIALFYLICGAVRLARFNTQLEDDESPEWMSKFFLGVPAPCGAGLTVVPMLLIFVEPELFNAIISPTCVALYTTAIALLMASRIPTYSVKHITVQRDNSSWILIFVGSFIIGLIIEPWYTLLALGFIYLAHIPISVLFFFRAKAKNR